MFAAQHGATVEELRATLETAYEALARSAAEIDPTLTRPVQGVKHQALAGLQDIEKKLVQHLKRRQETELGHDGAGRSAGMQSLASVRAPGWRAAL